MARNVLEAVKLGTLELVQRDWVVVVMVHGRWFHVPRTMSRIEAALLSALYVDAFIIRVWEVEEMLREGWL